MNFCSRGTEENGNRIGQTVFRSIYMACECKSNQRIKSISNCFHFEFAFSSRISKLKQIIVLQMIFSRLVFCFVLFLCLRLDSFFTRFFRRTMKEVLDLSNILLRALELKNIMHACMNGAHSFIGPETIAAAASEQKSKSNIWIFIGNLCARDLRQRKNDRKEKRKTIKYRIVLRWKTKSINHLKASLSFRWWVFVSKWILSPFQNVFCKCIADKTLVGGNDIFTEFRFSFWTIFWFRSLHFWFRMAQKSVKTMAASINHFVRCEKIASVFTFGKLRWETKWFSIGLARKVIFVFRLQNNRVEALPKEKFGIFFDDCTYIIYAATIKGNIVNQHTIVSVDGFRRVRFRSHVFLHWFRVNFHRFSDQCKADMRYFIIFFILFCHFVSQSREVKPNITPLYGFIHFWLGANCTSDKSGNVAYKVIELDTHLESIASQYRETQEHESARFMSYFKDGIMWVRNDWLPSNCNHKTFQTCAFLLPSLLQCLLATRGLRIKCSAVPSDGQEMPSMHSTVADQLDPLQEQSCDDSQDDKIHFHLDWTHEQSIGTFECIPNGRQNALSMQTIAGNYDRWRWLRAIDARIEEENLEWLFELGPTCRSSIRLNHDRCSANHSSLSLWLQQR